MKPPAILQGLNDAQKAAVSCPASVLQVLAPPGSGKTRTLTARVAHHIANDGLSPQNVLVCTFTVKAAREMGERIKGFLGPEMSDKLILGTFHSICRRFLVSYGSKTGIDPKFAIADSADAKSAIARIVRQHSLTINPNLARSRISHFKANRISVQRCTELSKVSKPSSVEEQEVATVYRAYEDHLKRCGLLDYDDLLLRCADLLQSCPECVAPIEAVLVDEFQDTNKVQYDLMCLFSQHKKVVSVVGDPDQSIYGWRSAKVKNLRRMQDDFPSTQIVTLEENYRSSGCILWAAQQVIEQDQSRPQKTLMPTHSIGFPAVMRKLESAVVEAEWLVGEIRRISALTGNLLSFDDFAILLRSVSLSRLIETSLGRHGIPYRLIGGHRFFDRVEVRLLLDYLRVLDHPSHTDALIRIVNVPPRKIGEVSLEILLVESTQRKMALWDVILKVSRGEIKLCQDISVSALRGLDSFVNLILTGRRKLQKHFKKDLASFLHSLIEKLQLHNYLREKYPEKQDHEARLENIEELIAQCVEAERAYYASKPSPANGNSAIGGDKPTTESMLLEPPPEYQNLGEVLSYFLANISLCTDAETRDSDSRKGSVTLSTMHAAKGLEWPVVFIPSAYKGSIPHSRAEDSDEERRLLYVAMTRAQSMLYMSYPVYDSLKNHAKLSPFLSPQEVARHLTDRGPNLGSDRLSELSKILGRFSPDPATIERARAALERIEDDVYPQCNGPPQDSSDPEASGYVDNEMNIHNAQGVKRVRSHDIADRYIDVRNQSRPMVNVGSSASQIKPRHLTSTTNFSPTFVKASSLENNERLNDVTPGTNTATGRNGVVVGEVQDQGFKRSKKAQYGQTAIQNYFAPKRKETQEEILLQSKTTEVDCSSMKCTDLSDESSTSIKTACSVTRNPTIGVSKISVAGVPLNGSQRKVLGTRREVKSTWNARSNR